MNAPLTRLNPSRQGFTLVETLIAAAVFTSVFLVVVTLLSQITVRLSGGDSIGAAQIADSYLASFQVSGKVPTDTLATVDGIRYRLTARVVTKDHLTRLWLLVTRDQTGDTIATFYTEKYVTPSDE